MADKTPSPFDLMGAFNNYYNDPKAVGSLSVVTDFGKSVPKKNAKDVIGTLTNQPTQVTYASMMPVQSSFFSKVLTGMEKAYNLSAQTASFALTLGSQYNPLSKGWNAQNLKDSWNAAREISPGQAFTSQVLGAPVAAVSEILDATKLGNVTGANKFIKNNLAFGAKDFNIYDKSQRDEAFKQQAVGRFTSWGGDVIARFTIDPTIFAGKAVKAYRVAGVAIKDVTELRSIIAGEQTGIKSTRIKNNFDKFIEGTDNMEAADLFRVKAIRESSNPGSFAEVMADANKIEDKAIRHKAKTNIVLWAMGDPKGAIELMQTNKMLAAKLANLQDEIVDAKYLGSGVDKATGQLTMDLLNSGENAAKHADLAAQYEQQIAENLKELSTEGILSAKTVPTLDMAAGIRQQMANSQAFIDIRGKQGLGAVYSSYPVRLMTGFAYKRPKGWIDFTDNQSAQTLDNMLSRVRGISNKQQSFYVSKIAETKQKLAAGVENVEEKKILEQNLKSYEQSLKSAAFTVERKNELFDRYISAINPVERARVYQEIEQELFNTVAKQFGYDQTEVNKAWAMFSTGRDRAHNLIRERAYTGKIDPETGGPIGGKVTPIAGTDGSAIVIPLPLNETQLAKQLPTLDIDSMYYALNKYTRAQRFEKGGPVLRNLSKAANSIGKGTDEVTDALDSIIKFEVLARLGYPIRNVGEGFLRIMQVAGPMAIMARVGGGIKNTVGTRFKGSKLEDMFKWSNEVKLHTFRQELEASLHVADDPAVIERQIAEIDAMLAGKVKVKDKFGLGLNEMTLDGEVYRLEDALGATPEKAKYIHDKFISNAAKIVDSHFGESSSKLRNIYETNGDFVIIKGTDPQWEDAYLRVVNRQVRQSKLTSILLQDKPREVLVREAEAFLQGTPEGRNILKNLALGRDVESIVEANMQNVESLFPSWVDPQLKAIASKRNLTSEDLKKFYGTAGVGRPDVNGAQVSLANGTSAIMRGLSSFLNNFYHYFGEVPESELVRNPLFVDTYRKRVRAAMENAVAQYPGERIPPEYLRKVENEARQFARSEARRTLYDTSERVDSAHMLKYVFPFFGAFADVTEKWGKMILDDPSVFRKLQTVYASPDRVGMTEERDGITYINIPGSWGKRMGLDRPMAIPKPSLNLIFQGGAWWNPGAGWFVQYPLSVMIKNTPDWERNKLIKQVLPYGADGTGWQDFIIQSSAMRRAMAIFDENNPTRSSLTVLITAEENHKFDMGERDSAPTAKEIDNKVRKILALEAAARLTLPFATNTRSPYQFYIDEYHRMRQEDPQNAGANFYDQYGDQYFIFATNLSKNNTGINATIEADKRTKQFSDLIAKNPEYGWFIVGDANAGEFSPTVYQKQRETPIRPGSKTKQRESQDPYEAISATNAEKGWIQYNKGIELIESQRIARGLKSLNSKGAEDLAALKKQFVADLEAENPDWASARGKIDTGKIVNFLKFANKAVQDPRLKNRPDMKLMSDYLEGRSYIQQQLAQRKSQSLDNTENADLKAAWDEFTGQLIDEDGNGAFTRIFSRVLEKDDLRKGL